MSATPMPEAGQQRTSAPVSIPYGMYFQGLDKPHWSSETDGMNPDPEAAASAKKSREVVSSARRRMVGNLHDSIRRLDKAVSALNDMDETGMTDYALIHVHRRLAHTISSARTLLVDVESAVDTYRTREHEATTPPAAYDWQAEDADAAADARAAEQVLTALSAIAAGADFFDATLRQRTTFKPCGPRLYLRDTTLPEGMTVRAVALSPGRWRLYASIDSADDYYINAGPECFEVIPPSVAPKPPTPADLAAAATRGVTRRAQRP